MRLEEQYRKCAVVIGTGAPGSHDEIFPWGTGFLVNVDVENSPTIYLITGWHVVHPDEDAPFDIRFNKKTGGAENLHIDEPYWVTHPTDKTIDVAVHELEIPEWADCTFIPRVPTILGDRRFRSKNIGAGNRTYTVGLWRFLQGDRRNQPFVYSGHIGLVPEDQKVPIAGWLPTHDDHILVDAYLVEGEPLDGASGSPVFVRRSIPYRVPDTKLQGLAEGSIWLLGIQSNAWFGEASNDYPQFPPGGKTVVPRGVNAVIPSMKLNEVLDHPDLIKRRDEAARA